MPLAPALAAYRMPVLRPIPPEVRQRITQWVVLSILLHALLILMFGAPTGGSRQGRSLWGSLDVTIMAPPPEPAVDLKVERSLGRIIERIAPRRTAPPPPPPPPAPVDLGVSRTIAPPPAAAPPVAEPPPAAAEPVPALEAPPLEPVRVEPVAPIPPMLERLPLPERPPEPAPFQAPAPNVPRMTATPLPKIEALAPIAPAARMETPAPLPPPKAEPLPRLEAPPAMQKIETPAPLAPAPRLETPAPLPPAKAEPLPRLEAPPPIPRIEAPAPIAPPAKMETPAPIAPPAKVETPAPIAPSPRVETGPEVQRIEAPAARSAPDVAPRSAEPAIPPAGSRTVPQDTAPSPFRAPAADSPFKGNAAPATDYDPTKPSVDLDAARRRAGELARQGTGNRAAFALPMPPVEKPKSDLEKAIEKARKPDCRTAYKDMGLLAVVPLVANEFGEGNCRW